MCKKFILFVCFVVVLGLVLTSVAGAGGPDPNVLWWKFEEGTGDTVYDSSGNTGREGAINGATWLSGGQGGSWCLEFGGDGDYVEDADGEAYINGLTAITIAMWIKSDVTGTNKGFIIFADPSGNDRRGIRYDSAGANGGGTNILKYGMEYTSGNEEDESSSGLQTTEWQHVAMTTASGAGLKLYINGELDSPSNDDGSVTGTITGCTTVIVGKGGKDEGDGDGWDGLVDDVRIYDYVLTPAQVLQLLETSTASNPVPANGATIDGSPFAGSIFTTLSFVAGYDAVEHEVFFSDNRTLVEARDSSVSLGAPYTGTMYYVGVPDANYSSYTDSLERGTWYYWCADETDSSSDVWQGPVWSFYLALEEASSPKPEDNMTNVIYTPTLSWGAGVATGYNDPHEHDIYFGTSEADVNNATYSSPEYMGYQEYGYETWDTNTDGGLPPLDPNTDYYWRIDEAHGRPVFPPGSLPTDVVPGDVWTFSTIPVFPVDDPNVLGWWKLDEEKGDTVLDHSGYGSHGTLSGDPERVAGMIKQAIEFNGSDQYAGMMGFMGPNDINEVTYCMWVKADVITGNHKMWFTNESSGFGRVRCRVNNSNWSFQHGQGVTGNNINITSPAAADVWTHFAGVRVNNDRLELFINGVSMATTPFLVPGRQASPSSIGGEWRGGTNLRHMFNGVVDDVRVYDHALTASEIIKAASPPEAWNPNPPDGAVLDPADYVEFEVTWKSGADAAQHRVYWGTTPGSLTLVVTKALAEPNYAPPVIDFGQTYYWRVDEVNGTNVVTGDEWSFSTVREAGMGSILVERWLNVTASTDPVAERRSLDRLKNDPRYPDNPDETFEVPWFHSGTALGDDYGGRIHGWLMPETSGDYRFWLATDDPGELWLSDSADPFSAELIAYIANNAWADQYQWDKFTTQDSNNVAGLIHLEADQKYYICALWKEGSGGDHCVVAWQGLDQPLAPVNGSGDAVIDGYYLMPFTRLWASNPKPRHRQELGANEVTLISWMPGVEAAGHRFWFDDDPDVTDAPLIYADLPLAANSINPSDYGVTIEWEKTYYWQVTEVNDANVWEGSPWWFRTTNYALLDNFEPYPYTGSSDDPVALRYVWRDGFVSFPFPWCSSNIKLTGMRDEYPRPYLHWDDYSEGEQAMAFYFDNDGNTYVAGWPPWINPDWLYQAPKYSEISAYTTGTTGLGVGQNWLGNGIRALSLWFKGNPTRTGSFQEDVPVSGQYTIISDGVDIGDVGPPGGPFHDEFHYAYNDLLKGTNWAGLGTITARVDSVENTNALAKAGVMMRVNPFPDANFVMVVVTPEQGVFLRYRDVKRGASTEVTIGGITAPHWVRLRRDQSVGNFVAEHANDVTGSPGAWQLIGPPEGVVVDMDPNILAGLCLTSHNASAMCTAVFSDVSIVPSSGTMGPSEVGPGWRNMDIGILSNDPEPMYLALEDTLSNVAVKYHDDPNAALISQDFQEWNIDLQDFITINPSLRLDFIDKVYIGFGDRDNPTTGGSGCVYFDDIRLYRSRFVPGYYGPDGQPMPGNIDDPNWPDGVVDYKDVSEMATYWLESDQIVPTSAPDDVNHLVAHWPLDANYLDYSGSGFHGTPMGGASLITEPNWGPVLSLDGTGDYVDCGNHSGLDFGTGNWSVCAWVKTSMSGTGDPNKGVIYAKGGDHSGGHRYALYVNEDQSPQGNVTLAIDDNGDDGIGSSFDKIQIHSSEVVNDDEWHHVVGLRDGNDLRVYIDGLLDVDTDTVPAGYDLSGTVQHNAYIGVVTDNRDPNGTTLEKFLEGLVDDVRIYDYALSDAEAAYLADVDAYPEGLYIPMDTAAEIANIYNLEAAGLKVVNFKDFAVLALDWLKEEPYWP